MTYDTNEYIFPKVLVLKTLIIQTETFSPQYKYPFGEFASFHIFWGVGTKNDDLRRYFRYATMAYFYTLVIPCTTLLPYYGLVVKEILTTVFLW